MNTKHTPLERLKHHVTGAIERGEKTAIVGQPYQPLELGRAMLCVEACKDMENPMEEITNLRADKAELLSAIQALGVLPDGYCFCRSNRCGDDSKTHEPECRDLRAAIGRVMK